jgi:hypothetical protein
VSLPSFHDTCASLATAALLGLSSCAPETVGEGTAADDLGDTGDTGGPNDPCTPGPNPSLEIGQGEFQFELLEPGGMIELIHGPQGGVHTLTGLLARDIDGGDELTAEFRGYLGDAQVGGSFPYVNFRCGDEGLFAWGVFLFWDAPPEQLHLQTVRIEVEFTSACGTVLQASKEAIIYDPTL